jgi:hypothetical protein
VSLDQARRRLQRVWPVLRAGLVGLGLVAILTAPTLTHLTSVGRLDTNDGRFSIWNIGWIGHALLTRPSDLLNANIFVPHTGTLAYSELNLVAGLFGLPWYAATGSALAALNGAIAIGLVLAFVCMWALVRRLTGSEAAGYVSATAFTFCPYVSARTPHVQLLMIFALPLVALAFHRLAEGPNWKRGVELGLGLAVAALACGYYGIYAGLMLVPLVGVFAVRSRSYWTALALSLATAALAVGPIYYGFLTARAASGSTLLLRGGESAAWSANVSSYLASGAFAHDWWRPALASWQPWNDVLFPGLSVLVLAAVALVAMRWRDPSTRWVIAYLVVALLALWASFGPAYGLYRLLELVVPGMALLRAPARLGIVVTFGLAVIAGLAVARWTATRRWLAPVLVLIVAAELGVRTDEWGWPSWPLRTAPAPTMADRRLAELPPGATVEFPFPYVRTNFHNHALAMYWSTHHWQPLVNGYSDVTPADFEAIARPINGFPDEASFRIMRDRNARYVLFRIPRYDAPSRRALVERLERYDAYVQPIWRDEDAWLYQITSWPP